MVGTERYTAHLPFQVFCCESGTHVVDPEQSYYRGIEYRASTMSHNLSSSDIPPEWDPESQCMDSTQMYFCRDLWTDAAKGGLKGRKGQGQKLPGGHVRMEGSHDKRDQFEDVKASFEVEPNQHPEVKKSLKKRDAIPKEPAMVKRDDEVIGKPNRAASDDGSMDDEAGTNMDAMPEPDEAHPAPAPIRPQDSLPASAFLIPNTAFTPARILVNPRCVTTYGGVSHTQLALDLFGTGEGTDDDVNRGGKYVLEDWAGPPDSFVCQEMRTTGGRTAPKSQRRVGWLLQNEVSTVGRYFKMPANDNLRSIHQVGI
jgi:hypothetical protein